MAFAGCMQTSFQPKSQPSEAVAGQAVAAFLVKPSQATILKARHPLAILCEQKHSLPCNYSEDIKPSLPANRVLRCTCPRSFN